MANLEKTLLLFDWDAVIFNAEQYKAEWTSGLVSLGISPQIVQETYQAAKEGDGYTIDAHQALLSASYPELSEKIRGVFEGYLARVPAYIFADAKELIITAGLKGAQTGVLSAGSAKNQNLKIERSGLLNQFNFITIVPYGAQATRMNKTQKIAELLSQYEKIIFFEDDTDVLEEVATRFLNEPKLTLVYVNRDGVVRHVPNHTIVTAALDSGTISKLCFE